MLKTVWKCVQCTWICDASPTAVYAFCLRYTREMHGYGKWITVTRVLKLRFTYRHILLFRHFSSISRLIDGDLRKSARATLGVSNRKFVKQLLHRLTSLTISRTCYDSERCDKLLYIHRHDADLRIIFIAFFTRDRDLRHEIKIDKCSDERIRH